MEPGGEGRLATKASNRSKQVNEDFLSEVFSLLNIFSHAKTDRKDAVIMLLVEIVENSLVSFG
jgi:hypothetical protein